MEDTMSMGMSYIRKIDQLRMMCDRVGLTPTDRRMIDSGLDDRVYLTVTGDDSVLPVYTRGVYLFAGHVDECLAFLQGWSKYNEYLQQLRLINDSKVATAEAKHLAMLEHSRTLHALRTGQDRGLRNQQEPELS